mmetsp:Transcript_1593/g.3865  ORF Transcript_1593/g.3865 Transcript_1593/m.3865 type:complete len:268 (-) Transcript_1593:497-1300(-)
MREAQPCAATQKAGRATGARTHSLSTSRPPPCTTTAAVAALPVGPPAPGPPPPPPASASSSPMISSGAKAPRPSPRRVGEGAALVCVAGAAGAASSAGPSNGRRRAPPPPRGASAGTGTVGGVVRRETCRNLTRGDVSSKAVLAALCSSTCSAWPLLPSMTIGRRSRMVCVPSQCMPGSSLSTACGGAAATAAARLRKWLAPLARPSPVGIGRLRLWAAPRAPPVGWQVAMTKRVGGAEPSPGPASAIAGALVGEDGVAPRWTRGVE